ncbi:MAG: hypothetical protein GY835_23835 [bacterium]|nr:hypothetical protein [bacterium]
MCIRSPLGARFTDDRPARGKPHRAAVERRLFLRDWREAWAEEVRRAGYSWRELTECYQGGIESETRRR